MIHHAVFEIPLVFQCQILRVLKVNSLQTIPQTDAHLTKYSLNTFDKQLECTLLWHKKQYSILYVEVLMQFTQFQFNLSTNNSNLANPNNLPNWEAMKTQFPQTWTVTWDKAQSLNNCSDWIWPHNPSFNVLGTDELVIEGWMEVPTLEVTGCMIWEWMRV